jgi:nitrogenase molybdenum-iron protein alpha chain
MENFMMNGNFQDSMKPGSFIGATLTASGIKNALIIFHGIAGCNIEAIHFRSDQIVVGHYVPIVPTGLNQTDCLYGGYEKLITTLRDTLNKSLKQKRSPEIVFILTSDATSIIGDDIEKAANIIEAETGIKTIAIDCPGIAGGTSYGCDITAEKLLKKFIINFDKREKEGINIVFPYLMGSKNWINDLDEMKRLLEYSEVKVNTIISRNLNVTDLDLFLNAKANYNPSLENTPTLDDFSKKYEIKTINHAVPLPLGVANTEEWLFYMAENYGNINKAKDILKQDAEFINSQLKYNYNFSWISTLMHGKYCSILGDACFTASLARCLYWDFGIIPKVIGLIGETQQSIDNSLKLLEPIKNVTELEILINPTYHEYGQLMNAKNVDFSIGAIQDKPLSMGYKIPHLSLGGFYFYNQYNFIPYPNMGIRGVLGLLTELSKVLEDAFYLKDMISEYSFKGMENKDEGSSLKGE